MVHVLCYTLAIINETIGLPHHSTLSTLAESKDAIDAAIQSAESLFASLLVRASITQATSPPPAGSITTNEAMPDPESALVPSLLPRQQPQVPPTQDPMASLQTLGALSLGPAQLTAHAHAIGSFSDEVDSPKESLRSLVSRVSVSSLSQPLDFDTVYRLLQEREKDLEVAARIGQTLLRRNEVLEAGLGSTLDSKQQCEQELAQLKHDITQKEELLRLYAEDAKEREGQLQESGDHESSPEWVRVLTEECRELRESNFQLRLEADRLRKETADIEQKERDLVQQCLVQFMEAKQRLGELREESEERDRENSVLQSRLLSLGGQCEEQLSRQQQLLDDNEALRDQLAEAQESQSQLANEASELQEKYEECSVLLQEAQKQVQHLKEASLQVSNVASEGGPVEQESIVQEIEEALRKEIMAASTLPERPKSPYHYAQQRTRAVMETVRAATMATTRRLERLAAESQQSKAQESAQSHDPSHDQGAHALQTIGTAAAALSPIATSSPNLPRPQPVLKGASVSMGTAMSPTEPYDAHMRGPPSPIYSDAGSTISLPDEFMRYRNHPYVAPEKLQIVKPLEGSVTLLKWKLLATPQLGGATTFFSDASRPGVHMKRWKEARVKDDRRPGAPGGPAHMSADYFELKQKSVSTMDLSSQPERSPASVRRRQSKRERIIRARGSELNITVGSDTSHGMNDITGLLPEGGERRVPEGETLSPRGRDSRGMIRVASSSSLQGMKRRSGPGTPDQVRTVGQDSTANQDSLSVDEERQPDERGGTSGSSSFLRQVGSFFGFSKFGLSPSGRTRLATPATEQSSSKQESSGPREGGEAGLAGIL